MCAVLLVLQIQLELGGAGPDPQGVHTTHCDSLLAGKSFPTILQPPPASHGGWGWWWSLHTPLPAVHCVFLFYPVRLADQPLHCPRARAVYLLGGGGMFFLLRETQMFKTVPRARVFILDGAIFFMEWKTAVFSCPH